MQRAIENQRARSRRTCEVRCRHAAAEQNSRTCRRLAGLGLIRVNGHEHFNGRIVFPITTADGGGRIVDVYGHKIRNDLRKGTPLELHLNEKCQGVWNIHALRAGHEIILSPTLFDTLTFWSHGYRDVTCPFGPEALTC